jgi:hypothetical protein
MLVVFATFHCDTAIYVESDRVHLLIACMRCQ